jgi:hypothetical protein
MPSFTAQLVVAWETGLAIRTYNSDLLTVQFDSFHATSHPEREKSDDKPARSSTGMKLPAPGTQWREG